jgi:Zn-finger nucleic acid-binding protein
LSQLGAGGMVVDVCSGGCGGIWFDNFELKKVDEPHESADALLGIPINPAVVVDAQGKRQCPKCDGQAMRRHFSSIKKQVELDSCPNCGGYWLDAGELALIRHEFKSDKERKQATGKYFNQLSRQLKAEAPGSPAENDGVVRLSGFFDELAQAGEG